MPVNLAESWSRVDKRRARSRQRKIGASQIGGCRRYAGYIVAGMKPTDDSGPKMAAYLGTAIHTGALNVLVRETGAIKEVRLSAEMVSGSADAIYLEDRRVLDLKTVSRFMFDSREQFGPAAEHWTQTMLYAWMLREGHIPPVSSRRLAKVGWAEKAVPIENVTILYVCRDTGREAQFDRLYDPRITREAMGWLAQVYEVALDGDGPDALPRDHDGPGLDYWCDSCPFKTACWGQRPSEQVWPQASLVRNDTDVENALSEYTSASEAEKEASRLKALARAKLTGSQPGQYGGYVLGWRSQEGRESVDLDAVRSLYAEAGLTVPVKRSRPSMVISVRKARTDTH